MLSVSFKPIDEPFAIPARLWPNEPTLTNYANAFRPEFWRQLLNSTIVSVATILVSITAGLLAAYSISRFRMRGLKTLLILFIVAQMFPVSTMIIPIFQLVNGLDLLNTYTALIGAYITITLPVAIWMLYAFVNNVPRDMEEAAMVDGATRLQAFLRVVVPVVGPGIAATAVWIAVVTWQEFIFALALTTSQDMRTVSVGMSDFIGQFGIRYGELMSTSVLISIPVIALFLVLQRHFVAGLMAGSAKG